MYKKELETVLDNKINEIYGFGKELSRNIDGNITNSTVNSHVDNSVNIFNAPSYGRIGGGSCGSGNGSANNNGGKNSIWSLVALVALACISFIAVFAAIIMDDYFKFVFLDIDKMFYRLDNNSLVTPYKRWSLRYKERTFRKMVSKMVLISSLIGIVICAAYDYPVTCIFAIIFATISVCYYLFQNQFSGINTERAHYVNFRRALSHIE
jgi:hypothetical protein